MNRTSSKGAALAAMSALRVCHDDLKSDTAFGKSFVSLTATDEDGDRAVLVIGRANMATDLDELVKRHNGKPQPLPKAMADWWRRKRSP